MITDTIVADRVAGWTSRSDPATVAQAMYEQRLDPHTFFRANRNQIINLERIHAIEPWFHGKLLVRLEGGHDVTMSRRRSVAFRETLRL